MNLSDAGTIAALVADLPASDTEAIAGAIEAGELPALRVQSAGAVRNACVELSKMVRRDTPSEVATALRVASAVAARERRRIDVVWTGPDVPGSATRLTSAALAQLVDEAVSDVLLISYVVYDEPTLSAALRRAGDRGVFIQILSERAEDNGKFTGPSLPFPSLPARRLSWPSERRQPGASMHAKVLVIDRKTALVGSANVTNAASLRNMEIGLIVRDPRIASRIADEIEALRQRGELRAIHGQ